MSYIKEIAWKRERHLQDLIARVKCDYKNFLVGEMGNGHYIQIAYYEKCIETDRIEYQKGRKWYVSTHATDSEVFQTMLKAALTSAEHQVREHFTIDGLRVFGPHMNIDELLTFAKEKKESKR